MSDTDLEARIVELEIRHTEQAELLAQLNEVVVQQQRTIDALTTEVGALKTKLAGEPGLVDAGIQEKPPHY
jgi:uncharacterized coiled-coil protein SlyX